MTDETTVTVETVDDTTPEVVIVPAPAPAPACQHDELLAEHGRLIGELVAHREHDASDIADAAVTAESAAMVAHAAVEHTAGVEDAIEDAIEVAPESEPIEESEPEPDEPPARIPWTHRSFGELFGGK